ncbi:9892_t:CDS:2, partial [Racocetra persica]
DTLPKSNDQPPIIYHAEEKTKNFPLIMKVECNEEEIVAFLDDGRKVDDELKNKSLESKGYETQVVSLRESKKEAKDDLNSLQEQLLGKIRELAEKDTEIVSLREQLTELLERELDDLEVDEEQTKKVRRLYRQFFQAKETQSKDEIENEIGEIRKELKKNSGAKNSRDACEKCKQLAKLDVQLEQQQNEREQLRASVLVTPHEAEEKFKEIVKAYETLCDEKKRREYDGVEEIEEETIVLSEKIRRRLVIQQFIGLIHKNMHDSIGHGFLS